MNTIKIVLIMCVMYVCLLFSATVCDRTLEGDLECLDTPYELFQPQQDTSDAYRYYRAQDSIENPQYYKHTQDVQPAIRAYKVVTEKPTQKPQPQHTQQQYVKKTPRDTSDGHQPMRTPFAPHMNKIPVVIHYIDKKKTNPATNMFWGVASNQIVFGIGEQPDINDLPDYEYVGFINQYKPYSVEVVDPTTQAPICSDDRIIMDDHNGVLTISSPILKMKGIKSIDIMTPDVFYELFS